MVYFVQAGILFIIESREREIFPRLGGTILAETNQFHIIYHTELAVSQYPIYCSCTLPLTMIYISAKSANINQNLFQWELKFDQYYEELQIVGRCNSVEDNVFRKLTFNTKFQHGLFGDFCHEVFRCYGRNTVGFFVRVVEINSSTDYLEIFALNQVFRCYGWDTVGVFCQNSWYGGKGLVYY